MPLDTHTQAGKIRRWSVAQEFDNGGVSHATICRNRVGDVERFILGQLTIGDGWLRDDGWIRAIHVRDDTGQKVVVRLRQPAQAFQQAIAKAKAAS